LQCGLNSITQSRRSRSWCRPCSSTSPSSPPSLPPSRLASSSPTHGACAAIACPIHRIQLHLLCNLVQLHAVVLLSGVFSRIAELAVDCNSQLTPAGSTPISPRGVELAAHRMCVRVGGGSSRCTSKSSYPSHPDGSATSPGGCECSRPSGGAASHVSQCVCRHLLLHPSNPPPSPLSIQFNSTRPSRPSGGAPPHLSQPKLGDSRADLLINQGVVAISEW
jgi:hypothetical protein